MKSVSHVLRDMLSRQGMHDRTAGTVLDVVNGDGERSRESALSHQPAGREGNQPMGNSGKGREPIEPAPVSDMQKRPHRLDGGTRHANHGTLRLIVNPNMSGMPMRKATERRTSAAFLMCIDGGKL